MGITNRIKVVLIFAVIVFLFLPAFLNQVNKKKIFKNTLTSKYGVALFFNQNLEKIKKNDDVIYT
ncbi:hypothetical protein ACISOH_09280, partial [Campylobacter jejuni]